jgi:hypothetical protein
VKFRIFGLKIGHLDKVLFRYRRHDSNISQDNLALSDARNTILTECYAALGAKVNAALILPFRNTAKEQFLFAEYSGFVPMNELLSDISSSNFFSRRVVAVQNMSSELVQLCNTHDIEIAHVPEFKSISETLSHLLENSMSEIEAIVSCTANFPFRLPKVYDSTLSKMMIFGYQQIFSSVRFDSNVYKMSNFGLIPIGNRQELKVLRDRVYLESGGVFGINLRSTHRDDPEVLSSLMGTIVIANQEAFEVRNQGDIKHLLQN